MNLTHKNKYGSTTSTMIITFGCRTKPCKWILAHQESNSLLVVECLVERIPDQIIFLSFAVFTFFMTLQDYYDQYVEMKAMVKEKEDEIASLTQKLTDQSLHILELQQIINEFKEGNNMEQSTVLSNVEVVNTISMSSAYSVSDQIGHKSSLSMKTVVLGKEEKRNQLQSHGELIPWTIVFKKSHPGSLSHLRKQQRDTIQLSIKEFLIKNIGSVLEKECYADDGKICIPESLVESFQNWFDIKIDEGILDSVPKSVTPTGPRRQSHANNTLVERAPAKEVVKNFIPGNEFAQTLSDVAEKEYPDVVISLSKFMNLIESFCQDSKKVVDVAMNRPLGVPVNKKAIRTKFEEVFSEDIEIYERNSNGKKRRSDVGPRVSKKSKPETSSGLVKESPQPLELTVPKMDHLDSCRYNGHSLLT
jgi:hypothetical protein